MKQIKSIIFIPVLFLLLSGNFEIFAQFHDPKKGGGSPDKQLSQKDNDYLDRQAKVFLDTVQSILLTNPPELPESRERGFAKLLMDAVFHEHYAAFRKPPQQFFQSRMDQVIYELENTNVDNGAKIWKLYNMGFIIRTKSVTLAFDFVSGITSGSEDFALNKERITRIVKQCDALFITHRHEDHGEKRIAQEFIDAGLPVFATEETWKNDSIQKNIINPDRIAHRFKSYNINGKKLDIATYPGHQMSGIQCNVYLVKTPEGITVSHLGDQINEGDFMIDYEWIDTVKDFYKVDIMMPSGWTMDIYRIARGFNPELVLPSHELELGHTVWDRLPFWGDDEYLELTYKELKSSKYPVLVLLWGESVHYTGNGN
jgi:L-ascorbate metabolism protein UlaG (beta-lactamase superfamily)